MHIKRCSLQKTVFFLTVTALCQSSVLADTGYQKRGNYAEGRRDQPVASVGIELISALADYREPATALADTLHAKFLLPNTSSVCLVAREKDNRQFYWLDQVQQTWTPGTFNTFSWPTAPVLKPMQLKASDIGVLVRLQDCPSVDSAAPDRIAPVMLYQNQAPATLPGYVFTYKLRSNAKISLKLKNLATGQAVYEKDLGNREGVFDATLPATDLEAGEYKVELSGYDLSNNAPVYQSIKFFHAAGPL